MPNILNNNVIYDDNTKQLLYQSEDENGNVQTTILWNDVEYPYLLRDIDTQTMYIVITSVIHGKSITKEIPLDEIQPKSLSRYSKYGFPFGILSYTKLISSWLYQIEPNLDVLNITHDLGWKTYEGESYFQLQNSICHNPDINVEYSGDMSIDSKGTFNDYIAILNDYVVPNIETQTILTFSVSSALASLLNPDLTLVLHMNGESTTGKTTMLKLAASVWGSTNISEDGIIQTWNTTKNALINSMCGFNGITLCYDELGASDSDISNLIYLLSNGVNKKRMYSEKSKKFSVNICSSGEIPLKTVDEVNGTDARLLEFRVQWTKNAQHSNNLTSALKNCYGLLGERFVKFLLARPKETMQNNLNKAQNKLMSKFQDKLDVLPSKKKRIITRTIQKIAVTYLTAVILKKEFNLALKPFKIAEFMLFKSNLLNILDDECIRMLEDYMQYRKSTPTIIKQDDSSEFITDEYICITKSTFYDNLQHLGYRKQNILNNLKELSNRNIIRCESGKLYNRHKIGNNRYPYIDISIPQLKKEGIDYE